MNWKLAMLPVFVVGLLVGAVAHSTAVNIYRIQNVGTIKSVGVEVFADEALTQILISLFSLEFPVFRRRLFLF